MREELGDSKLPSHLIDFIKAFSPDGANSLAIHGSQSIAGYKDANHDNVSRTKGLIGNRDLEKELRERSPISILRKHPEELEAFLDKFMDNSYEIYTAYLKGDEQQIKDLKKKQLSILFHEISNDEVMYEMYYLLLKQNGVMGGHKKKMALESISPKFVSVTYISPTSSNPSR